MSAHTRTTPTVRSLQAADHSAWIQLWHDYQAFYQVELVPEVTATTWQRFHDPAEPMFALGTFHADALIGIAHYLFHRTSWAVGPSCYLHDLCTTPAARGQGVGRALIAAGADQLYWLTHETNAVAMQLYDQVAERPGFVLYTTPLLP